MTAVTVDFWMDLGCPWSRISLVELDRAAIARGVSLTVVFHALRLDPDAPADYGRTTIENLCEHLDIDERRAEEMLADVVTAGARAGLDFNFRTARGGNSFDAHRLLRLAALHNRHVEVARELFRAHFERGLLLSDHDTLRNIALESGIRRGDVDEMLDSARFENDVHGDEQDAAQRGIARTPHFVLDGRIELSGVQWVDDFDSVLSSLGEAS